MHWDLFIACGLLGVGIGSASLDRRQGSPCSTGNGACMWLPAIENCNNNRDYICNVFQGGPTTDVTVCVSCEQSVDPNLASEISLAAQAFFQTAPPS